jgi:23S rRNA-/tRNA-specific pseudouridylate synthase
LAELGRDALSHISLIKFYEGYSHISIEIETGRTHQIRVHLSNQKLPIIGDGLYNPRNLIAKNTPENLITHIQNFLDRHCMPLRSDFLHLKVIVFLNLKQIFLKICNL